MLPCPAGEGPGGLTDVGFGVVADADREQLQEFAGEVLVRLGFLAAGAVEPDQHGSVADHGGEQIGELAEGVFAKEIVLPKHERHAADLAVAGGEVAVPEERQLFAEWILTVQNVVQPPILEHLRIIPQLISKSSNVFHLLGGRVGWLQESVHAGGGTVFQVALQRCPAGAEAGPPVQVGDLAQVPGFLGRGLKR